jgi:Cu/Ag efflux protein CusF
VKHPLTGVVMAVMPERGALLVKHEAIPGVMRAMTMLFKVDTTTLETATEGAVLSGQLVRHDGDFWLENVIWTPAK